jgi:hypothetical protein
MIEIWTLLICYKINNTPKRPYKFQLVVSRIVFKETTESFRREELLLYFSQEKNNLVKNRLGEHNKSAIFNSVPQ